LIVSPHASVGVERANKTGDLYFKNKGEVGIF